MTAVEIVLIIIGIILMIGSFFVTEKLSQKEVAQISELSSAEMKRILEKNMESAEKKVEELVDDVIDRSMEIADRALEKETNLKIQNISEYSETVLESIHKSHNEVMFLYSMLNDKHVELTESAGKLEKLKAELQKAEEEIAVTIADSSEAVRRISEQVSAPQITEVPAAEEYEEEVTEQEKEEPEQQNSNQCILNLHQQGMSVVEIAKQLGLGVGEVKLVIDLYRGEEA